MNPTGYLKPFKNFHHENEIKGKTVFAA